MSVWGVIFVVLMILWPVGGSYVSYDGSAFNGRHFFGWCLIPWACVLILGLVVFGVVSGSGSPGLYHHQ